MLRSVNPYNQETIDEFRLDSESVLQQKLDGAQKAFQQWRRTTMSERSGKMRTAASVLRTNLAKYARMISLEMGKAIGESKAEIEKCAAACEYFAAEAESLLRDEQIPTEARRSYVTSQPLGPVLAIMPWNFPFWQVFRFAAPSLMAGNVGLLKHASNVTGCSLMIQSVFEDAGFPPSVFQSLLIDTSMVEKIIQSDAVAAVTLTGSEKAGSSVASAAGASLKKQVLELGGSDPFIVLRDADLEMTAKVACKSRMQNAGQSCIAAKRFIVDESVKDAFINSFMKEVAKITTGDPLSENTTMGLIARIDLAREVEKQVETSITKGAVLVSGGPPSGCLYPPSIVTSVIRGQRLFDEEVFGPVAAIIGVKDEREAIAVANDHRYGLGASVWTRDADRGDHVARQIEAGSVFVNSMMRSDQRLPFGGIKKSGYGRELSEAGIKEFTNQKTVYVA